MRIHEIDYLDHNKAQYDDKIKHRRIDSTPMGRMWSSLVETGKLPSSYARAADDYLGLRSKCGGPAGNCAMTRFRSAKMLAVQLDKRTGKKKATNGRSGITPEDYEKYGIHIEHSIPVNLKLKIIEAKFADGQIKDYKVFTDMYTALSVGVGMTRVEEHSNLLPGMGSKHPDITGDLASLDINSIRPFARYTDDTVIYDMSTRTKISNAITIGEL